MLEPTGFVRDVQQGHTRHFRSPAGFAHIAVPAGSDNIGPNVLPTARPWQDMVPGQVPAVDMLPAVCADTAVPAEQKGVVMTKRQRPLVTDHRLAPGQRNHGTQCHGAALPGALNASVENHFIVTDLPGNLAAGGIIDRLLDVEPAKRVSSDVEGQYLSHDCCRREQFGNVIC